VTTSASTAVPAVVLTLAALLVAGAPARAASPPACDGVLVVVDPGPLGGGVREACADTVGSAADVMVEAGVRFTYAEGQPFVCRIDGVPGPDREDCRGTPPGDAYWGLFWSDGTGDAWRYSSLGLAALEVPAGGAVGWRFQDGAEREDPRAAPGPSSAAGNPADSAAAGPVEADGGTGLTWAAGGAVLLLAGATGVLALRRRS
jgi:hypothetical protein